MDPRHIFLLGLAILTLILPASATIEVMQGDTIYLGETVDISRVMSWSGQFAYFSSGETGKNPTKIVDVNDVGHMYSYYIDPAKFNVGTWYKWDGEEESAGNMLAFYIAPGTRLTNITVTKINNTIIKSIEPPELIPPENPLDTHLLLARGDSGILRYHLPNAPENGINPQGYIWLFGDAPEYDTINKNSGRLLGIPMTYEPNGSINSFTFSPEMSGNLQEGWYSGFIQFTGVNRRQDVFYDKDKNNLDSPYKSVEPVNLDAFTPTRVEQEFIRLQQSALYSDDLLIPISVELVTPSISIGDYWEEEDYIVIRGSTPMKNGTAISVVIDPDQYPLKRDLIAHTFNTTATNRVLDGKAIRESECIAKITELNEGGYNATMYNGTSYNQTYTFNLSFVNRSPALNPSVSKTTCTSIPRVFTIKIPIEWDNMAIGPHWIQATIEAPGIKTTMNKDFKISGIWVNPTPTMEFNKMIVVKQGQTPLDRAHNLTTVTTTPEPEQPPDVIITMLQIQPNTTGGPSITTVITPIPVGTPKPAESPFNNPIAIIIAAVVVGGAILIGWLYWG